MNKNPWQDPYVDKINPRISRPKGKFVFFKDTETAVQVFHLCYHGDMITGRGKINGIDWYFEIKSDTEFFFLG